MGGMRIEKGPGLDRGKRQRQKRDLPVAMKNAPIREINMIIGVPHVGDNSRNTLKKLCYKGKGSTHGNVHS